MLIAAQKTPQWKVRNAAPSPLLQARDRRAVPPFALSKQFESAPSDNPFFSYTIVHFSTKIFVFSFSMRLMFWIMFLCVCVCFIILFRFYCGENAFSFFDKEEYIAF